MKKVFGLCFLFLLALAGAAQGQDTAKGRQVPAQVIGKDTLPVYTFTIGGDGSAIIDSAMLKQQDEYIRFCRRVRFMLIYANALRDSLKHLDANLAKLDGKKDKRREIKEQQARLVDNYESKLKQLSQQQARVLVLLIHRQTGQTAYDLIKGYKSGVLARGWQMFATVGGVDLKKTYSAAEQPEMEEVLREEEGGR